MHGMHKGLISYLLDVGCGNYDESEKERIWRHICSSQVQQPCKSVK